MPDPIQNIMTTKDYFEIALGVVNIGVLCATAYFIYRSIHSPIDAVKVGRQLNQEEKKYDAKRDLFLLLFSVRGLPLHYDFVRGLNQIEVVFEDVPKVIQAWRTHYSSLQNKNQANPTRNWEIERAELLSAMAVHLGYSNIPHSELLRDYYPEGHNDRLQSDIEFRQELLNYLKQGNHLYAILIENAKNQEMLRQENDQS